MRACALAFLIAVNLAFGGMASAERIQGAGSTFAYPLLAQWSQDYLKERAGGDDISFMDVGIDYEPVGSIGGIVRLGHPDVDFALTDIALSPGERQEFGYVQFPVVIGGIVPVINLEGFAPGELKLTGTALADIYLGKIRNWSDPAIAALNPGRILPDLPIAVVHRTYVSGSTFNWTSFLSASNADWKAKYGADTLIDWPVGINAVRSEGMARTVKETSGAIGYLEYGQAVHASLSYAAVQNRSGQFVKPEPNAFALAAAEIHWSPDNGFVMSPTDATAAGAYPITTVTFALLRKEPPSSSRSRQTLWFFNYAFESGGAQAASMGYMPLPTSLVDQIRVYWSRTLKFEL